MTWKPWIYVMTSVLTLAPAASAFAQNSDSQRDGLSEWLVDLSLGVGGQWSRVSSENYAGTATFRIGLGAERRLYVERSIGIVLGVQVGFPGHDMERDVVQVPLRAGLAWHAHRFDGAGHATLEVSVAALVGPHIEVFHDPFFGQGLLVGLVTGGRADFRFLFGDSVVADQTGPFERFALGLSLQLLQTVTSPEHTSFAVSISLGGAFGRIGAFNDTDELQREFDAASARLASTGSAAP